MMDLACGPACPRCGCTDTMVLKLPSQESWYGSGRAKCGFCGRGFHFTVDLPTDTQAVPVETQQSPPHSTRDSGRERVYFRPVRCPECGSKETKVARKMPTKEGIPTIRYHKCKACNHSFKSVEEVSTP